MIINPSSPANPLAFQSAMVFVDGSNFIHRLQDHKLIWQPGAFEKFAEFVTSPRMNLRTYFYTNPNKLEDFKKQCGESALLGCRVVLGDGIPLENGKIKEKGVDALLVADLIYHAASKNVNHVVVITHDTDFMYALKRVEDFGVTTRLVALLVEPSDRLRGSADRVISINKKTLLDNGWAKENAK